MDFRLGARGVQGFAAAPQSPLAATKLPMSQLRSHFSTWLRVDPEHLVHPPKRPRLCDVRRRPCRRAHSCAQVTIDQR